MIKIRLILKEQNRDKDRKSSRGSNTENVPVLVRQKRSLCNRHLTTSEVNVGSLSTFEEAADAQKATTQPTGRIFESVARPSVTGLRVALNAALYI